MKLDQMVSPIKYPLVGMAMQMTKEEQLDIVPILFDGPGAFLTRAGQLIDIARACLLGLLAAERERGGEECAVENLRYFLGIIRTGAGFWHLDSAAGQARVVENYMRYVQDNGFEVTPELADTLFDSLDTLEKLIQQASRSLARRNKTN